MNTEQDFIINGLLDIKELIAKDDYDLYLRYKDHPKSKFELVSNWINNSETKQLFSFFLENQFNNLLNKIFVMEKDQVPLLLGTWEDQKDYGWMKSKMGIRNDNLEYGLKEILSNQSKRFNTGELKNKPYLRFMMEHELAELQSKIVFKDIINHKSIGFFEMASETDPNNLNWALKTVDPSRLDVITLLLEKGAKIKRMESDVDGYGYEVEDLVATELLKKKIKELSNISISDIRGTEETGRPKF